MLMALKNNISFPPTFKLMLPQKKEKFTSHNVEPLTKAEVKALADAEEAFQKAQKGRLEAERKEAKRQRSIARINKL